MKKAKSATMHKEIRFLIDRFYQVQEHRIAIANQLRTITWKAPFQEILKQFEGTEKSTTKIILWEYKKHIMYDWLKGVKGIGPLLGSSLVVFIDINRARHASSLWKYCGLVPGQKRIRGQKLDYSPYMKMVCWKIGESFVKHKGKYRTVYESSKSFYQKKFPKEVVTVKEVRDRVKQKIVKKKYKMYTKLHIDRMAKRRTVKLFLSHFWVAWRTAEGLPVSEPYSHRLAS